MIRLITNDIRTSTRTHEQQRRGYLTCSFINTKITWSKPKQKSHGENQEQKLHRDNQEQKLHGENQGQKSYTQTLT